jgi:DNA-binding transcriptional LysR family regulator
MTFRVTGYKIRYMLDVRRLKVLREVAARGSFSGAADALNFTQSAISQQIAALEREAGTRLVERSARGVRLTVAGEALVRHTDVILARLADAEAELEAIAGLRAGRVRLAAFPSVAASLLPPAIARYRERHPGVELTMVPAEPPEGMLKLRQGDVDLALLIDALWTDHADDGIDRTVLLDDPMYICLPAGHPLASKARLKLDDLADEKWLIGTSDNSCPDSSIFLRACAVAGFEPRIGFQTDDYVAIQGFVAAGMGISVIPDLALATVREDVVIRALVDRAPVRRISVGTLADGYRTAAVQAMVDILVEVAQEFAGDRQALALAS